MHFPEQVSLQAYNSLALPGRAGVLAAVSTADELQRALSHAQRLSREVVVLGEGSNIVLAGDIDGLVLLQRMRGVEQIAQSETHVRLRVAAGENWHALVRWSLERGLFGLQNLALIPGTVGAAPVQNIGAYGVELSDCLQCVHGLRLDSGAPFTLTADECGFAYRDSVFKSELRDLCCITAVELQLARQPHTDTHYPALRGWLDERGIVEATPQQVYQAVVAIRSSKLPDPAVTPNAGSFFKNPLVGAQQAAKLQQQFPALPLYRQPGGRVKLAAGWMIEYCGWKGFCRGGVGVHPRHALVLLNTGGGSGSELLQLAREIAASVRDAFGIALEMEPRIYGRSQ